MSDKRPYQIDRRRLLRGVGGVTLGLPMLDVFLPRRGEAAVAKKIYSVFVLQANGVAQKWDKEPETFWPVDVGPITADSLKAAPDRTASELKDHAARLTFIKGLSFAFAGNGCGHSGGCNQVLTAAKVSVTPRGNKSLSMGESVDNRIARELTPGREPFSVYAGRKSGYIDDAFSYRGPLQLRTAENNPWNAYQRMIGLGAGSTDKAAAEKLIARRKSANDFVRVQMKELLGRKDLSRDDRTRLDLHFGSIRDTELGLVKFAPPEQTTALQAINGKHRDSANMDVIVKLQMDLVAFALATDYARTATLQIGDGNDGTEYTIDGVKLPNFHQISHRIYGDGTEGAPIVNAVDLHHKIDVMHARWFKYLIEKMSATMLPETGGSLLDSGFAVWTNSLANGPPHGYSGVPYIIAGQAAGYLKPGQCVDVAPKGGKAFNNKLFNTLLAASGIRKPDGSPPDDFGDPSLAKGYLPQIVV